MHAQLRFFLTWVSWLAVVSTIAATTAASALESVTFITAQDRFTVKKTPRGYDVDGKPVLNHLLETLDPYLKGEATDDCPALPGKAPVTAKIGNETREFFVNRGIIRVGAKCFFATGDGLYYLPMHRTWLVGPFREHLNLNSPLRVSAGPTVFANLTKTDGRWSDTNPRTELDWDFFQKFERALADYTVQYRVLTEASKGKPMVRLQSGSQSYNLYKLGPKLWAIQRPGKKWLDASGDWSWWFDLDQGVWQDRHVPSMRKIETAGTTPEQKMEAMHSLEDGWSRALEDFFQRRLLDGSENLQVRMKAMARLRSKPTWHNIGAMMTLIASNPSDDMLKEATQALRARNPKGPLYVPGQSDRSKTVADWQAWWQQNRTRKD